MTKLRVVGKKEEPKTELCITRLKAEKNQTLGRMEVRVDGQIIWACGCLELPWIENNRNVSCIPRGRYPAWKRTSAKHGQHIMLGDVPGRSMILIHAGNTYQDTRGCILPGFEFGDIDNDGIGDALSSSASLAHLLQTVPETFEVFYEVPAPQPGEKIEERHLIACKEAMCSDKISSFFNPYINWEHMGRLRDRAIEQKWPVMEEGFAMKAPGPREWATNLMHAFKDHVGDTTGLEYEVE